MINKLRTLHHDWQAANREIGRQKLMFDPVKIVLLDDFIACFDIGSMDEQPTLLKRAQRRYADEREDGSRVKQYSLLEAYRELQDGVMRDKIHEMSVFSASKDPNSKFEELIDLNGVRLLWLPLTELPKDKQLAYASNYIDAAKQLADAELRHDRERTVASDLDMYEAMKIVDEYTIAYPDYVPVAHLGELIAVADRALETHPLGRVSAQAVLRGQSAVLPDFWRALNALKDHTGYFETNPGPPLPSPRIAG